MIFVSIIASLCCSSFQQREWYYSNVQVGHCTGQGSDIGDLDGNVGGETDLGSPLTVASGGGEEKSGEGEQTIVLLCLAFHQFHLT